MIEIKIPQEIRNYKEKLILGMTLRQIICLTLAIAINVPMYMFLRPHIGDEIASWIIMITGIPLFLIGFFKYNNMNFESFAMMMIRFNFMTPQKRKYKTENVIAQVMDIKSDNNLQHKNNKKKKKKTDIDILDEFESEDYYQ